MKVRLLPPAYDDIDRLEAFLIDKDTNAAARVHELLFDAAASLADAPRRGRPLGKIYRELIVSFGKSAYILRYRIEDSKQIVFVVRIWHGCERRR